MTTDVHTEQLRLIDAHLEKPLPTARWEALRAHLRGCETCRVYYDRAVLAERLLAGGPGAALRPSPAELDRVACVVLDEAAAPEGLLARLRAWSTAPRLVAVLGAAAVLILLPLSLLHREAPGRVELMAHRPELRDGGAPVRLFAEAPPAAGASEEPLRGRCGVRDARPPFVGEGRCPRGTPLAVELAGPAEAPWLLVVAVDEARRVEPVYPEHGTQSGPAPRGGPFVSTGPLAARPDGGLVVYALYSPRPLALSEVSDLVGALPPGPLPVALPFGRTDLAQRSLRVLE